MARKMSATMPLEGNKSGCTRPYTWPEVIAVIRKLYEAKRSMRRIAREDYHGLISHAVIQRVLDGREPHEPEIRKALGMEPHTQVYVVAGNVPPGVQVIGYALFCIVCGQPFIPNHPARKRCFICSPYRKHEEDTHDPNA